MPILRGEPECRTCCAMQHRQRERQTSTARRDHRWFARCKRHTIRGPRNRYPPALRKAFPWSSRAGRKALPDRVRSDVALAYAVRQVA